MWTHASQTQTSIYNRLLGNPSATSNVTYQNLNLLFLTSHNTFHLLLHSLSVHDDTQPRAFSFPLTTISPFTRSDVIDSTLGAYRLPPSFPPLISIPIYRHFIQALVSFVETEPIPEVPYCN